MANFKLYMALPSDIGNWWEVAILPIGDFLGKPIDEQPNSRFDWSELTIKNNPLDFKNNPLNRYKLYDLIKAQDPTINIQIKFKSNEYPDGIFGYFGSVDCTIENDLIKVKPTIYDENTPLMENRETEVILFDDANIIKNPMFGVVANIIPDNWLVSDALLKAERRWLDNNTAVEISDIFSSAPLEDGYQGYWDANTNDPHIEDGVGTEGDWFFLTSGYNLFIVYINGVWISSTTPLPALMRLYQQNDFTIQENKQAKFSFNYFLAGTSDRLKELRCDVFLHHLDTIYRLRKDGSWGTIGGDDSIEYGEGKRPTVPVGNFDKYKAFSVVTARTPIAGNITVMFYRPIDDDGWDASYSLILTNVQFLASDIELKAIKVKFSSGNLITSRQDSDNIHWDSKPAGAKYFGRTPNDTWNMSNFIDVATGEPIMSALNIITSTGEAGGLTYSDLINIFNNDPTQKSYKYELSKVTVYSGQYVSDWPGRRHWYAVAEFSREEIWKKDPMIDIDTGLPATSTSINIEPWKESYEFSPEVLLPPEAGSGWAYTTQIVSGKRLWVRFPFNDMVVPWIKGEQKTYTDLQTFENNFGYYASLTTEKAYPISTKNSFSIGTAIDLRNLIEKVYNETYPLRLKGKKVYSSFLWNDCEPEGVLPDTVLVDKLGLDIENHKGTNYVEFNNSSTGDQPKNILNNIVAVHTYELRDAIDQKYGDENSILKLSFKKLWDDLLVMFRNQIYFFIDSDLNLHIEHLKHFDKVNTPIEMRNQKQFAYIKKYESWKYDKTKMYSLEEYEMKNSGFTDFKNSKVSFAQLPTNKRENDSKVSYATQYLSTDIQFCKENAMSIDNGILLIAYDVVLNPDTHVYENVSRYATGQKSTNKVLNGDLAISTLHEKYGRYEGTWLKGFINDNKIEYSFSYTKRTMIGEEITFKGIFKDSHVLNNIGRGLAISKIIDFNSLLTKVVFAYRYGGYESGTSTGDETVVPVIPTVETIDVSVYLSSSSIKCYGNVTSDGNSPVTERGICYGTNFTTLTIEGTKVVSGSGIGSFESVLSGLMPNINYNFRAYAINSVGVAYGLISVSNYSIREALTVTTNTNFAILSETSILSGGIVVSQGASAVTVRGMIVSFRTTFSLNNALIVTVDGSGIGSFESTIEGLVPNRTYYVRAYATNSEGTSYGNIVKILR